MVIYTENMKGRRFYYNDLSCNTYDIEEIAHALSMICRAGGHFRQFYSVATHSILIAEYFIKLNYDFKTIRTALLHDATEAYIGDVITPLKNMFPEIKQFEDRLYSHIAVKFDLFREIPNVIKIADTKMLNLERSYLLPPTNNDWGTGYKFLNVEEKFKEMLFWDMGKTKKRFLELYNKYKSRDNLA